jgi:hypothetical protein
MVARETPFIREAADQAEIPEEIRVRFGKLLRGGIDIVPTTTLNNPIIDCAYHDSYHYKAGGVVYYQASIACQLTMAYVNYQTRVPFT